MGAALAIAETVVRGTGPLPGRKEKKSLIVKSYSMAIYVCQSQKM